MRPQVIHIPAYDRSRRREAVDRLESVRRLARLMDSQFTIPGTNITFGIDPLLGLFFPGVGSVASSIVSLALISTMRQYGASGHVVVRMLFNVLIDTTFGSIPILGSVFDVYYRANEKNLELLRRHYDEGRYQGSGAGLIALLLLAFVAVCGLSVWGFVALLRWMF